MRELKLRIGGRLVDGASTINVINPATGELLVKCPRASATQAEQAIVAAKAAFPAWSAKPWKERSASLLQLADALENESADLRILPAFERSRSAPRQ